MPVIVNGSGDKFKVTAIVQPWKLIVASIILAVIFESILYLILPDFLFQEAMDEFLLLILLVYVVLRDYVRR